MSEIWHNTLIIDQILGVIDSSPLEGKSCFITIQAIAFTARVTGLNYSACVIEEVKLYNLMVLTGFKIKSSVTLR